MSLLSLLLKSLTSQSSLNTLSNQTGASSDQINKLLILAVPLLLKYLTKNASTEAGALSLLGALGQHKGRKALSKQLVDADTEDGELILGHILGKKEDAVTKDLVAKSGMDEKQVLAILASIAPALLTGISAAAKSAAKKKKQGFDLEKYAGKEINMYSYSLENPPGEGDYLCSLYVCKGKVIGGDIHSTAMNGQMTGIR